MIMTVQYFVCQGLWGCCKCKVASLYIRNDQMSIKSLLGNGSGILFREYCFGEENSLSLTEFWGKLGEFCEKLGEFAFAHK